MPPPFWRSASNICCSSPLCCRCLRIGLVVLVLVLVLVLGLVLQVWAQSCTLTLALVSVLILSPVLLPGLGLTSALLGYWARYIDMLYIFLGGGLHGGTANHNAMLQSQASALSQHLFTYILWCHIKYMLVWDCKNDISTHLWMNIVLRNKDAPTSVLWLITVHCPPTVS